MKNSLRSKEKWLRERIAEIVSVMSAACANDQLPEQGWIDELSELLEYIEAEK